MYIDNAKKPFGRRCELVSQLVMALVFEIVEVVVVQRRVHHRRTQTFDGLFRCLFHFVVIYNQGFVDSTLRAQESGQTNGRPFVFFALRLTLRQLLETQNFVHRDTVVEDDDSRNGSDFKLYIAKYKTHT